MPDTNGNAAQTRIIAEQVAESVITRFTAEHPEIRRTEIPAPLKWASAIIAGVFTVGVAGMAIWLVSTVNDMQVTLARMDERMSSQTSSQTNQFDEISRRLTRLEAYHATGGQ